MKRKILWLLVSGLMLFSLLIAACGQPTASSTQTSQTTQTPQTTSSQVNQPSSTTTTTTSTPTTPASGAPKYGGTLNLVLLVEPTIFDSVEQVTTAINPYDEKLWMGDWAKGPAGGYGTNETDWLHSYDDPAFKTGFVAQSIKWSVDSNTTGTIVAQIRQGVHYGLNPAIEASRLVNGRELTADDVVWVLNYNLTTPRTYLYKTNPELRSSNITKTGPWEVTMKVPLSAMMTAITRFGDGMHFWPPEVMQKYGNQSNWKLNVGTGPFIRNDYIPASVVSYIRNPNYWQKDPVGPGKGSQLPYLDGIKQFIIPDASTRQAAMRTGKLDYLTGLTREDANAMAKQVPALKMVERTSDSGKSNSIWMRTDKQDLPFKDAKVRRAMIMAIDYQSIVKSLLSGKGQIPTVPYAWTKGYGEAVFNGLDDPDMPADVKELFSYNTEKAKDLLKQAGYPTGFKTSIITNDSSWGGIGNVDYLSIIKDMWSKIGIDLTIEIKDTASLSNILVARNHTALAISSETPVSTFYLGGAYHGTGRYNLSMLDDPVINKALEDVNTAAISDLHKAMQLYKKEMTTYIMQQAYVIPTPVGSQFNFYWPWVKNYSGEMYTGYDDVIWYQYVWYDQDLKKQMGK